MVDILELISSSDRWDNFAAFSGVVAGLTAVVVIAVDIPEFVKSESARTKIKFACAFVLIASITGQIAGTKMVTARTGEIIAFLNDKAQEAKQVAGEANERAALANERAKKLEIELAATKKDVAIAQRDLAIAQKDLLGARGNIRQLSARHVDVALLISTLQKHRIKRRRVSVVYPELPESEVYAKEIARAFRAGDWTSSTAVWHGTIPMPPGVSICTADSGDRKFLAALKEAKIATGEIKVTGDENDLCRLGSVIVGAHPAVP